MSYISYCFILLVKISSMILSRSDDMDIFVLLPTSRVKLSAFQNWISCIFLQIPLIILRTFVYIPSLLSIFIINVCWIMSGAFSAPIEVTMWFFFFNLLYVSYIDWFLNVGPVWHPQDKLHLVMLYIPDWICWHFAAVFMR